MREPRLIKVNPLVLILFLIPLLQMVVARVIGIQVAQPHWMVVQVVVAPQLVQEEGQELLIKVLEEGMVLVHLPVTGVVEVEPER